MTSFIIPERIIPAQTITACGHCPHYKTDLGPWGNYQACGHWRSNGEYFDFLKFDPEKTIWIMCPALV
jgi:hypothetical protein